MKQAEMFEVSAGALIRVLESNPILEINDAWKAMLHQGCALGLRNFCSLIDEMAAVGLIRFTALNSVSGKMEIRIVLSEEAKRGGALIYFIDYLRRRHQEFMEETQVKQPDLSPK